MAIIGRTDGTLRRRLRGSNLIGRGRRADIRLEGGLVSGEHASIRWTGEAWEIKDLASRNGTWVNAVRMPSGATQILKKSDTLSFGDVGEKWTVICDEPLRAFAQRLDTEEVVEIAGDMLALPGTDNPAVVIAVADDGRWRAERTSTSEEWVVEDRAVVLVEDVEWRLCLPEAPAGHTITFDEVVPTLANAGLRFVVRSADEHVTITALIGSRELLLGEYASYYLLLHLARARLADAADTRMSEDEHGWRFQDEVLRSLKVESSVLYLEAHRARGYFARRGILDTRLLIERRRTTQELRIGVQRLIIDEG